MRDRDVIEVDGVIADGAHGLYGVTAEVGGTTRRVLCRISGRLNVHRIKVMTGDRVRVEVGAYDLTRGRIVRRL